MLTDAADEWSGLLLTDVEEEEPELLLLMVTGWRVTEGPPSNWKQKGSGSLESILHFASFRWNEENKYST